MVLANPKFFRAFKRFEDVIFSLTILIIFAPVLIIVCILAIILQGFPIFYVSHRVISKEKEFQIIKFRTMVRDAKSDKYRLNERFMNDGYLDIPLTCEVYTSFGRFLEKTQLVEVPQIFGVLLNKMSFVGNRPLPRDNIDLLKKKFPNKWKQRFGCPAGITGITQVVGKFYLNPEKRLELEALYSKVYRDGNVLKADAYIFFSTLILVLLRHPSAYRSYESAKNVLNNCLGN